MSASVSASAMGGRSKSSDGTWTCESLQTCSSFRIRLCKTLIYLGPTGFHVSVAGVGILVTCLPDRTDRHTHLCWPSSHSPTYTRIFLTLVLVADTWSRWAYRHHIVTCVRDMAHMQDLSCGDAGVPCPEVPCGRCELLCVNKSITSRGLVME